jgi:hypothetical protein
MASVTERRRRAAPAVRWGVAWRGAPGQDVCGDLAVALPLAKGMLLGAIDGLGHGVEAADAARRALETLKAGGDESVPALFKRCHDALLTTRGVVMSLATYLPGPGQPCLSWLGVGNVEGLLVRPQTEGPPKRESLLLRSGVVGFLIPALTATVVPVRPGDLLVLASDGIRNDFGAQVDPAAAPQAIADRILERCEKGWDDALVLVARLQRGGA